MNQKSILTSACYFFVVLVLAPLALAEKVNFRIGSASLGSSGYIHWEACAFLANKYSANLKPELSDFLRRGVLGS